MTPQLWLLVAVNAAGWIFAAGGAWFLLQQVRRDVNGLGAKVNRLEREAERKFTVLALLLVAAAAEEDKGRLVDRLLDKLAR